MALAFVVAELQWIHAITWDEVEFFRATRWIAEGRVAYRDFWEHHLPLQWVLFAPFAAAFGGGAGVAPILAMRWIQIAAWIGLFAAGAAVLRRAELDQTQRRIALLLLLGTPLFLRPALEYRVDVIGNLAFIAALWMATRNTRAAWIAFGALMSSAVLANMRLAPLVIATAAFFLFVHLEERRWKWNPKALSMLIGALAVALVFVICIVATGATDGLIDGLRFNIVSDRMLSGEAKTFLPLLGQPWTQRDLGAFALWLGAIAGAVLALRDIRRPGLLQILALLAILSVFFIARLGVQYIYHFQTAFLLMAPLAASVVRGERAQLPAMLFLALILAINLGRMIPPQREPMQYHDVVMRAVDQRTKPGETVWDGCGFALRRDPAYRYWFLPSGVRLLAIGREIETYDVPQMAKSPPGAIVHSIRVNLWLQRFPRLAAHATHHYIPLYRDLWIPGMSAIVGPRRRVTWLVPRTGRYRVYAADVLVRHPWFTKPLDYAMTMDSTVYELPLRELPVTDPRSMRIAVDGVLTPSLELNLKQGSILSLDSLAVRRMGVLIVPDDVTTLFMAPDTPVIM